MDNNERRQFSDIADQDALVNHVPANENGAGTTIHSDEEQNIAADAVIDFIMSGADAVPPNLLKDAGEALANRYCFAICYDETADDYFCAMVTPLRYFEETGVCSDQTGPISHLLPKCTDVMASTWEIQDRKIKTVADAARYFQKLGFIWHKNFQDFIDDDYTKELSSNLITTSKNKPPKFTPQS